MCVWQAAQAAFLRGLLPDVLSYAGAVMIRRIMGIAHVADLDSIADADARCRPPQAVAADSTLRGASQAV